MPACVCVCVCVYKCVYLAKTRCSYASLSTLRLTAAASRLAEVSLLKTLSESENTVAMKLDENDTELAICNVVVG